MSGEVIVDASLAIKWVVPEIHAAEAAALLNDWTTDQVAVIAPSWFACEVANALYQKVRQGLTTLPRIQMAITTLLQVVELRDVEPPTAVRAVEIADLLGERASYDSQYAALAERLGCELWTGDKRFRDAVLPHFPWVRWVGEKTL